MRRLAIWIRTRPQNFWISLAVFFAVILPRGVSLGDFPWLDDGYHAFIAQTINDSYACGNGFPGEISGFKLFEVLFFWVWRLPGNALFWLRLADLLAAAIAGWLFCLILIRESKSRTFGLLLAFAGLCGLNLPGAIQSGFKHSFFPAFACFFAALELAARARPKLWLWAGALTALGVLFRETFFPFALLGCVSLLFAKNFAALWRFAAGGAGGAIAIAALSALVRGQYAALLDFYFKYGRIYEPEAGRRWLKFTENGSRALALYSPLLAIFACCLFALAQRGFQGQRGRLCFWLACALLPLAEPLLKIGFLYHFSVCIPGICGFCACAFALIPSGSPALRRASLALSACACLIMAGLLVPHFEKTATTAAVLRRFPAQGWPPELAERSTTLAAARAMRELAPGGTASSTGFAYFVFPASGMLPPEPGLGDLSRAWIHSGYDPVKFRARLDKNPPDLVLIAHTDNDHSAIFESEIKSIFDSHPDYRPAGVIKADPGKNYGWLGYSIYRRIKEN